MSPMLVSNGTNDRLRAFAAELSRLLIVQGFDVDMCVRPNDVRVTARLYRDGKQAGYHEEYPREMVNHCNMAPLSIAIIEADKIRELMPEPS